MQSEDPANFPVSHLTCSSFIIVVLVVALLLRPL